MKNIAPSDFKIINKIKLKEQPSKFNLEVSKSEIEDALKSISKRLGALQKTMYAHDKYSVLVCLQGMDTSGKDSLVREVFKNFNVRGIVVHSFKVPTELELGHDYL
jgi:polyphosphate kinase 2 (PPK2 family)